MSESFYHSENDLRVKTGPIKNGEGWSGAVEGHDNFGTEWCFPVQAPAGERFGSVKKQGALGATEQVSRSTKFLPSGVVVVDLNPIVFADIFGNIFH